MTTTKRPRRKQSPPPIQGAPRRDALASPPTGIMLDGRLDLPAAAPLRLALLARRGHALVIEASDVTHLGGSCAQVLAAAAATWATDGVSFAISAPSDPFREAARLLGLNPILITEGLPA